MSASDRNSDRGQVQAELLTRRAQYSRSVARIVFWVSGGILILTLLAWMIWPEYGQLLHFAACVLLIALTSSVYPLFHRRGQVREGTTVYCLGLLLGVILIPLLLPGALLAVGIAYILLMIVANQVLGEQSLWLSIASAMALVGDVIALELLDVADWFIALPETALLVISALLALVAFLVVALILHLLAREQDSSFVQARQAALELEQRAAAEQAQKEHLQSTVEVYVGHLEQVAAGNLASRISLEASDLAKGDPLHVLGQNINRAITSLQHMIQELYEAASNINSAAAEILAASSQQASGASEQSAAISQASTTIDEVRTIAEQTAQRAQAVANLAQQVEQVSQAGRQAVAHTVEGMEEVQQKADSIAQDVLSLSDQAQAIGGIIATVAQIANQSKILALNASVEAARAGEAGAGFAVVAQEVRNLAAQSRSATEQVREILTEIQHGVNTAVMAAEEGMKGALAGMRLAEQAGSTIHQLGERVTQSVQSAQQISAAAAQQQVGVEQIAQAMQNILQVTTESVVSSRQVEKAAGELNALAGRLQELVEVYRA